MDTLHDSLRSTGTGGLDYVTLMSKPSGRRGEEEVILAFTGHENVQPFVTWKRNVADGSCYWGHYFISLRNALEDYDERL